MNTQEELLRALLNSSVPADLPPSRVDVAGARRSGRHRLRLRRALLGGGSAAALSAVTAVALATGGLALPGGAAGVDRPAPALSNGAKHRPARAPSQFNPLVPYAAFGTLPEGFSARGQYQSSDARSVSLTAAAPAGGALFLSVYATGACVITRTAHLSPIAGRHPAPPSGCQLGPPIASAPRVHGARAYWVQGGLIWEYAPGAWSALTGDPGFFFPHRSGPSSRQPSRAQLRRILRGLHKRLDTPGAGPQGRELLEVAGQVRYGQAAPIAFPYRLRSVPAGWRVASAGYQLSPGLTPLGNQLSVGPSGQQGRSVSILTIPVSAGARWCGKFIPGQSQDVTVAGVSGVLRIIDNPLKKYEELCVGNDRGMSIDLTESSLRSLTAFFARLRPLGTDPARWTVSPLP